MKPKLIFSAKKLIEEINMANRDIFDRLKQNIFVMGSMQYQKCL
jgi:hypothetical protein